MDSSISIGREFGAAAERYESAALLQAEVANWIVDPLKNLSAASLWLDIGAGTGFLAQRLSEKQWVQVDVAEGMCRLAARYGPAICADAAQLPFPEAAFEVVASSLCFQWFPDPETAFAEMRRVLRPKGRLVFTTLIDGTLPELANAFARSAISPRSLPLPEAESLMASVRSAGFDPVHSDTEVFETAYDDAHRFLKHFSVIGAKHKGVQPPLDIPQTRRLLAALPGPMKATYRVMRVVAVRAE